MINNFNFFSLSIFQNCSFNQFTDVVENYPYYREALKAGKVVIQNKNFYLSDYYDPKPGGHFERFSWWDDEIYPNTIFLVSNMEDGLYLLCKKIRDLLQCPLIRITMSSTNYYNKQQHLFQYYDKTGNERLIMANKEDRWVFFEKGEVLPFENINYYKRRIIRDRINNEIVNEYLMKCGIDLNDIECKEIKGLSLERLAWNI